MPIHFFEHERRCCCGSRSCQNICRGRKGVTWMFGSYCKQTTPKISDYSITRVVKDERGILIPYTAEKMDCWGSWLELWSLARLSKHDTAKDWSRHPSTVICSATPMLISDSVSIDTLTLIKHGHSGSAKFVLQYCAFTRACVLTVLDLSCWRPWDMNSQKLRSTKQINRPREVFRGGRSVPQKCLPCLTSTDDQRPYSAVKCIISPLAKRMSIYKCTSGGFLVGLSSRTLVWFPSQSVLQISAASTQLRLLSF